MDWIAFMFGITATMVVVSAYCIYRMWWEAYFQTWLIKEEAKEVNDAGVERTSEVSNGTTPQREHPVWISWHWEK